MTQYQARLKTLLRELFQFDSADLDFGIYAILNHRREQIDQFIEADLLNILQEALEVEAEEQRVLTEEKLVTAREDLKQKVGPEVLDTFGNVVDRYKQLPMFDIPIIRQTVTAYELAKTAYETGQLTADTEAQIYNDLYRFFARYYDDGDFIAQRRFGPNKYALPYGGQEVYLHWANANQYYIKSGEHFTDYVFTLPATLGDQEAKTVRFKLRRAETDRDNNKSQDKRFFVLDATQPYQWEEATRTLTLHFEYRPLTVAEKERLGMRDPQDKLNSETLARLTEILPRPELKAQLIQPEESTGETPRLIRHLHRYTARHTRDYFIHQNLAAFLRQELDYFLKNEILNLDDIDLNNPVRARLALARVRTIRQAGQRAIAFLAQIENFQKRLFEKRKFVLQSDYCLTLDRIPASVRAEVYQAILANPAQLQAWRDLYALEQTEPTLFNPNGDLSGIDENFLNLHPYLMLDTAYLSAEIKARLLSAFDNLEAATDGLLIHGENFQALNLLLPRYQGQIKCIYIDPPYNTGHDEFIYKDNFQHSSWLTMMENRLYLARELLTDDGVIFISIDDGEQAILKMVLSRIFGEENFVANIIWQKMQAPKNAAKHFSDNHDFLICYAKYKPEWYPILLPRTEQADARYKNPDNDPRGVWASGDLLRKEARDYAIYPITAPSGRVITPPPGTSWRVTVQEFERLVEDNRIWFGEDGDNVPRLKRFLSEVKQGITATTIWTAKEVGDNQRAMTVLKNILYDTAHFETPKSVELLERVIKVSSDELYGVNILDFFAGSGTTAHAVMSLNQEDSGNRKYILVEMGDYFDTVLKPRIQKVTYTSQWKDGRPVAGSEGQSHMFQYLRLESYEDTLNNITFKDRTDPANAPLFAALEAMPDYLLHYMLSFETEGSPALLNLDKFVRPFDYRFKDRPQPVDLVITFNLLLGLQVETQREFVWETGRVVRVVGRNPAGRRICIVWRNLPGPEQMEAEKAWLSAQVLAGLDYELLYLNGESALSDAQPLEPEFKRLMFATVTTAPPLEGDNR